MLPTFQVYSIVKYISTKKTIMQRYLKNFFCIKILNAPNNMKKYNIKVPYFNKMLII